MAIVGVMGLGKMGGAFAERLRAQGYETVGYDVSEEALARFEAAGGRKGSLDELAACPVVLSSLPSDREVADAFGDHLLQKMQGGTIIELSTILPDTVVALANKAERRGVQVIDCPVSGGIDTARNGSVVLYVGADEELVKAHKVLLEQLGTVWHVGKVGNGKAVKLVNNVMSLGNVAVASEAFQLGIRLGMDPQALYDVLNQSGGRSHNFTRRMPSVIARDFTPRFATYLAEKDLRLALQMGHDDRYPMPIASTVHQLFEMALAKGFAAEDSVSVIKVYEEWGSDGAGQPR